MRFVVFGAGQMGRAVVQYYLSQSYTTRITLVDPSAKQLSLCKGQLDKFVSTDKLQLNNSSNLNPVIASCDLVLAAIPWSAHAWLIDAVSRHGKPLLSLSRPKYDDLERLRYSLVHMRQPIMFGCGLEPGLTEILALDSASQFDRLEELHIKCGGVSIAAPNNVLRYKALFGTDYLPISIRTAFVVNNGELLEVPRFSGLEHVSLPEVGTLEAWHDGMVPWLYSYPQVSTAHTVTQKTLRWPGFSAAVMKLHELGLLSEKKVSIGNAAITPKQFIEKLYSAEVTHGCIDDDITILMISARGIANHRHARVETKLVAHNDPDAGLNSMARITGFTLSCIGYLITNGDLKISGLANPESAIRGQGLAALLRLLGSCSITVIREVTDE